MVAMTVKTFVYHLYITLKQFLYFVGPDNGTI